MGEVLELVAVDTQSGEETGPEDGAPSPPDPEIDAYLDSLSQAQLQVLRLRTDAFARHHVVDHATGAGALGLAHGVPEAISRAASAGIHLDPSALDVIALENGEFAIALALGAVMKANDLSDAVVEEKHVRAALRNPHWCD
jgi:predicted RNA methylase